VWLVGEDGKTALHTVKVGRYLTGKVIISDGLKGGEKVVVAGGQLLHPGMFVEIASQTSDQGAQP
jgi:multidrug efflux pump subunit AcrA (membrane-fusion protein)